MSSAQLSLNLAEYSVQELGRFSRRLEEGLLFVRASSEGKLRVACCHRDSDNFIFYDRLFDDMGLRCYLGEDIGVECEGTPDEEARVLGKEHSIV